MSRGRGDALPEDDLPPAFGRLARWLDPVLAAEDTNIYFKLFRQRRCRRRGLKPPPSGNSLSRDVVLAIVFFTALVTLVMVLNFGWIGLAIPPAVVALVWFGRATSAGATDHLPLRLGDVFAPGGTARLAATDLYLSGMTGREAVEAVYLESREHSLLATTVILAVLFSVVAAIYLNVQHEHWSWKDTTTLAVLAVFALSLVFAQQVAHASTMRQRLVVSVVAAWWGEAKPARDFLRETVGNLLGLVLLVLVAVSVVAIVEFIEDAEAGSNAVLGLLMDNLLYVLANMIILMLLVPIVAFTLLAPRRHARKTRAALARADLAFARFMAVSVFNDPDGHAWAAGQRQMVEQPPRKAAPDA
jgi:hypothetical protein